jgi:hypothetical protein
MATSPDQTVYYSGQYKPGLGHVGSYQVAGMPYITGSTTMANNTENIIRFPSVTKSITVINRPSGSGEAPDIRVHFASTGAGIGNVVENNHFITLTSNKDSLTMNVKCSELYISRVDPVAGNASWQVFAELTGIPAESMLALTGSGITE